MELKLVYTDKEITTWGGRVLLKHMLNQIGWGEVVNTCPSYQVPDRIEVTLL